MHRFVQTVATCLATASLGLVGVWAGAGSAAAAEPICYERFAGELAHVRAVEDVFTIVLADGRLVKPAGFYLPTWLDTANDEGAASLLGTIVERKWVQIFQLNDKQDRHGRVLAFVALADGRSAASELVAAGKAMLEPARHLPCLDTLRFAENLARRQKRGLWADFDGLNVGDAALLSYEGHYVTVRGRVLNVGIRTKRHYLNFGAKWSEDFTAELAPSSTKRLFGTADTLKKLEGQWVTVRGRLRKKGGPMIVLEQEGQIDFNLDQPDEG